MNIVASLNDWIKNPNRLFADGVSIYNSLKANSKCDDFFAANIINPSVAAANLLFQKNYSIALKILANPAFFEGVASIKGVALPASGSTPPKSDLPNLKGLSNLPPELVDAGNRIRELMPIKGALHAKLRAIEPNDRAKAKSVVAELIPIDDEMRSLWGAIDSASGQCYTPDVPPASSSPSPGKRKGKKA